MTIKRHSRPIANRVLVKLKKAETVSAGGIIIQTDEQEKLNRKQMEEAYVVRIGELAWRDYEPCKPLFKVGDLVRIVKYAGANDTTIEDGEIYQTIYTQDVINVMEGEGLND